MLSALIVGIVATTVGWVMSARGRSRTVVDLEAERNAHQETQRSSEHLETRMRTLRSELAEAHHTNADLTARASRVDPRDAGRALGLWSLERLRQARVAGTPLLGLAVGPGMDLTAGLTEAIRVELEVLREDVGTHAELTTVELGAGIDARDALTVLRTVQELTAILAKRADELQVSIEREHDRAIITVAALGWDDSTPNTAAFESGLDALDGALELRPDPETADTLLAIVTIEPSNHA